MSLLPEINQFAKDCREGIARGQGIPLADIEEGLYNEDYFTNPREHEAQNQVDLVHEKLVLGTSNAPTGNPNIVKQIILYPLFLMI